MSPALNLVGIDLSLTSAGGARVRVEADGTTGDPELITFGEKGKATATTRETLDRIRRQALRARNFLRAGVLAADDVTLFIIEGGAFAASTAHAHTIAGNWWVSMNYLVPDATAFAVVQPATVKRYATSFGGGKKADKSQMLLAANRMRPALDVRDDNQADAFVMLDMLATELGHPLAVSPQRVGDPSARATVDWPDFVRTYRAARP